MSFFFERPAYTARLVTLSGVLLIVAGLAQRVWSGFLLDHSEVLAWWLVLTGLASIALGLLLAVRRWEANEALCGPDARVRLLDAPFERQVYALGFTLAASGTVACGSGRCTSRCASCRFCWPH